MKKISLLLAGLGMFATFAGEISLKWNSFGKPVPRDGNQLVAFSMPGGRYSSISSEFPVKKGNFYQISFAAKGQKGSVLIIQTSGFADKVYDRYRPCPLENSENEEFRLVFYAPETANLNVRIYRVAQKDGASVSLLNVRGEELSAEQLQSMQLPERFTIVSKAKNTAYTIRTVGAEDHIDGGTAVEYLAEKGKPAGIVSWDFPALPSATYELTFWAKSEDAGQLTIWIDGWASKRKHFYMPLTVRTSKEFQRYVVPFRTPDDVDRYCGVLRLILTPRETGALTIKQITVEGKNKK